ncbi:hypothetical protein Noda2021_04600 [Candidatus Dependentiae bacterium Noda2021]|nr:hypothetical protein Noda2021_04600 [Candidatus Dependentiae bacterium Noda2021]
MVFKIVMLILCGLLWTPSNTYSNDTTHRIPLTVSAACAAGIAYGSWRICSYCLDKIEEKNLPFAQSILYHTLLLASSTTTAIASCLSPLFLINAVNITDLDMCMSNYRESSIQKNIYFENSQY